MGRGAGLDAGSGEGPSGTGRRRGKTMTDGPVQDLLGRVRGDVLVTGDQDYDEAQNIKPDAEV